MSRRKTEYNEKTKILNYTDKQWDKLYRTYSKRYADLSIKYKNLENKANLYTFKQMYTDYYISNPQNIIRSILKDTKKVSRLQAKTQLNLITNKNWEKYFKKNKNLFKDKDIDKTIKTLQSIKYTDLLRGSNKAKLFWEIHAIAGSFEQLLYVDND